MSSPPPPKQALLVIDMQDDFLNPQSPLCVANGGKIVSTVQRCIHHARAATTPTIPIMYIIREHDPSGVDVERFRAHLYPHPAPVATASPGAQSIYPLPTTTATTSSTELVIVKKRFSAFFHTHLDLVLRRLGVSTVVLTGVQTPNCIRATAFDAVCLEYDCIVLEDGTASANDDIQSSNLRDMKNIGIQVCTSAQWMAATSTVS